MITVSIARDLSVLYPDVRVGFFTATHRPIATDVEEHTRRLAMDALQVLRNRGFDIDRLAEVSPFSTWRKAFAKGGLQPSKYRSSVESLTRRALRNDQLMLTGNAVVDIYNAISIKHLTPMGAYDLKSLPTNEIELRFANPESDRFEPVGGDPSQYPLKTGMPVYACSNEVLCYGFNHRDSSMTACHPESDPMLFVAETISENMASNLEAALAELRDGLAYLKMETSQVEFVGRG